MRKFQVLLALIAVACLVLNTGWAFAGEGKTQGQPFLYLQKQIDELRAQIQAIQLTPGPQGPPGPAGPQGEPGAAGVAGTPCWDLNENGSCDLTDEDRNRDGRCSVLDCQGASGIGALGVYDAKDVFLGYFVDYFPYGLWVFDPDIQGRILVSVWPEPVAATGKPAIDTVYFTQLACNGIPFAFLNFTYIDTFSIYANSNQTAYFVLDMAYQPIQYTETLSQKSLFTGQCIDKGCTENVTLVPMKSITFPLADVVLQAPITIRAMN